MARNNGTQQNGTQTQEATATEVAVLSQAQEIIKAPAVLVSEREARLARLHFRTEALRETRPERKRELQVLATWAAESQKVAKEEGTCDLRSLKKEAVVSGMKYASQF